ncbi:MAG: DAK2 domain-containing protein [Desulfitobacteriaceae bacterium]
MMISGAYALGEKRKEVDALNIFPVPDGDTGTNMHLTVQSAAKEVAKTSGDAVGEVAAAISLGSLMGARGNSGVILSQLLRGVAKGLEGVVTANSLQIAQALQIGVETAYKAVMKPVEGTILTVSKETAKGALGKAKTGGSPLEMLREGYRKGLTALAKTPEQLPVLKQAGVVDAGGQGFLVILSGWIAALEGHPLQESEVIPTVQSKPQVANEAGVKANFRIDDLEYPYCTEFLIKGIDIRIEQIRNDLEGRGDSLLVVGTPELVKTHIHTKNPGQILDYAIQWGALHEVAIHNMLAQNEAMAHAIKEQDTSADSVEGPNKDTGLNTNVPKEPGFKEHGIVAVTMGDGIARVFTSLGVDQVVYGGQTMNPSTEELVEAVRKVSAHHVYILPNNKNIILAARQVREIMNDREVHVIPSKSIPQGISALLNFLPEGDVEHNLQAMEGALSRVGSGEVTYAVRDSQYEDFSIAAGDILGLVEDGLVATGRGLLHVAQKTLEQMRWREYDLVTIFLGRDVQAEEAKQLEDWLLQEKPTVEVEVYPGGQPLYYYIFGVE